MVNAEPSQNRLEADHVTAAILAAAANLISGATVRWIGCQPDTRQRIYFANHTSNLDFVLIWTALPPALRNLTCPAAAHDYWTANPLRQYVAQKVFRAVLIERKKVSVSNNPIATMLEAIGQTRSLIIFPEGRRNTEPEIAPFKGGLFHLAKKRPDIELVPVHIENLNRILPRGEFLPVPLLSCISFGAPMHPFDNEIKSEFLKRARQAVVDLHQP